MTFKQHISGNLFYFAHVHFKRPNYEMRLWTSMQFKQTRDAEQTVCRGMIITQWHYCVKSCAYSIFNCIHCRTTLLFALSLSLSLALSFFLSLPQTLIFTRVDSLVFNEYFHCWYAGTLFFLCVFF